MFAGEIEFDQSEGVRPGTLKLRLPESRKNANLVVNDMTLLDDRWKESYEDLRAQGMPRSKLDSEVLAPLVSGIRSTLKVITVQINFIPGGCLLSFCVSHSFVDASGAATALKMWAKHCRELQNLPKANDSDQSQYDGVPPSLHKGVNDAEYHKVKHRPELWHLLALHATENLERDPAATTVKHFRHLPAATLTPHNSNISACIFSINSAAMKKLKQEASPHAPEWVSSGDALVALLWRSIMRARFPPEILDAAQAAKESMVSVAVDGRKLRSLQIPPSYIGSVIFCSMTRLPMGVLLSPKTSLADTALMIRRNLEAAKDQQILEDAISLASSIPDVRSLKSAYFQDFFGADLITSSWIDLPFYDIEFGPIFGETGRAEFFWIPKGQLGGMCSIQPRRTDGIIDVNISLDVEQMRRLRKDEEFAQYFQFFSE